MLPQINPDIFNLFDSKTEAAIADLLYLINDGEEFPDAVLRVTQTHKVTKAALTEAYDSIYA
jgi:hypothetical protein